MNADNLFCFSSIHYRIRDRKVKSPVSFNLFTSILEFVHYYHLIRSALSLNLFTASMNCAYMFHQYQYPKFVRQYPWIHSLVSVYLFGGIPLSLHWHLSIHSYVTSKVTDGKDISEAQQRYFWEMARIFLDTAKISLLANIKDRLIEIALVLFWNWNFEELFLTQFIAFHQRLCLKRGS